MVVEGVEERYREYSKNGSGELKFCAHARRALITKFLFQMASSWKRSATFLALHPLSEIKGCRLRSKRSRLDYLSLAATSTYNY